jgi:hypothetical protein
LAVAAGGKAFGKVPVRQCDVLLLALEDSPRRLQGRIRAVYGSDIPPRRLHILTQVMPGLLIPTMTAWLQGHPGGLVILDTLGRARQQRRRGDDAYLADYQAGVALKNVVDAFPGSALLGVHHTRKAPSDDFVDDLSGTLGLAGSADYVLVLRRQRNSSEATLQVTGRDAPEGEYAFTTAEGAWTLSGNGLAEAAANAQNRRDSKNLGDRALEALAFVNEHPAGVVADDLADHLGISSNDAGTYLRRLHSKGRIDKPARGIYTALSVSEVSEVSETEEGSVLTCGSYTKDTSDTQTDICSICEVELVNEQSIIAGLCRECSMYAVCDELLPAEQAAGLKHAIEQSMENPQ